MAIEYDSVIGALNLLALSRRRASRACLSRGPFNCLCYLFYNRLFCLWYPIVVERNNEDDKYSNFVHINHIRIFFYLFRSQKFILHTNVVLC